MMVWRRKRQSLFPHWVGKSGTALERAAQLEGSSHCSSMGFSKSLESTVNVWTPLLLLRGQSSSPSAPAWPVLPVLAGSACLLCGSERVGWLCGKHQLQGKTQEGVEPCSGPDMRARPLAEMLLTAVFESAYFSSYLQHARIRPTAGDCSSQSMLQTSPSLCRVPVRSPFPQFAEEPQSLCSPKLLAVGSWNQACFPGPQHSWSLLPSCLPHCS